MEKNELQVTDQQGNGDTQQDEPAFHNYIQYNDDYD